VVGRPANVDPWWHFWHSRDVWAPVSLNAVLLWLNVDGDQALVEWQVPQLDPIAPVWLAGFA
jgi:hypothetical protein